MSIVRVIVTDPDGTLFGEFALTSEDVPSATTQRNVNEREFLASIGEQVLDQVPPSHWTEPEPEPEGLAPGFADALRSVYPELRHPDAR